MPSLTCWTLMGLLNAAQWTNRRFRTLRIKFTQHTHNVYTDTAQQEQCVCMRADLWVHPIAGLKPYCEGNASVCVHFCHCIKHRHRHWGYLFRRIRINEVETVKKYVRRMLFILKKSTWIYVASSIDCDIEAAGKNVTQKNWIPSNYSSLRVFFWSIYIRNLSCKSRMM